MFGGGLVLIDQRELPLTNMSATEHSGTAGGSVVDRVERLEDEREARKELKETVDAQAETIEAQEKRIADLETDLARRPPLEMADDDDPDKPSHERIESLRFGDFPLGGRVKSAVTDTEVVRIDTDIDTLFDRVEAIERDEIDPGDVISYQSNLLACDMIPLQQLHNVAEDRGPSEHGLSKNKEIAARVFPYIVDRSQIVEGVGRLPSPAVKELIMEKLGEDPDLAERLDVRDPNSNTVRRVMKFIGEFGGGIFEFDTSNKTNRITFRRNEWVEYVNEVERLRDGGEGGGDYSVVISGEDET